MPTRWDKDIGLVKVLAQDTMQALAYWFHFESNSDGIVNAPKKKAKSKEEVDD